MNAVRPAIVCTAGLPTRCTVDREAMVASDGVPVTRPLRTDTPPCAVSPECIGESSWECPPRGHAIHLLIADDVYAASSRLRSQTVQRAYGEVALMTVGTVRGESFLRGLLHRTNVAGHQFTR